MKKAQADNAEAVKEIEDLKKQLTERGINLENANASIAEQRKALEEYARRTEQLDAIRKRFELLQSKLQKLTQLGLKVEVRNNRMLIQLPGDVLFDSGKESLKDEGKKILLQIGDIVRGDADLSKRQFQVAGLHGLEAASWRAFQGQLGPFGDARAQRARAAHHPARQGRRGLARVELERGGLRRYGPRGVQRHRRGS